ncbi:hypothetical protein AAFF_G00151660, partial [Aldrovandia affinis]
SISHDFSSPSGYRLTATSAREGVAAAGVGERAKGSKMADLEDVTLDGRPLHSLRVADLKAALEQRGLPKSGQKNALIKRLKGALMLENLQRTSTAHIGLQPNSQIGEEMSQNSFIKQYLAKQQELLRQRLEREAREAAEADDMDSPAGPDHEDHAEANDSTSCPPPDQEVSPVAGAQNKRHPFDQREEKEEGERGWGRTDEMGREDGEGETEDAAMGPATPFSHSNARKAAFYHGQDGQGDALAPEPGPQEVPGSRARRSSARQSRDDPTPSSPSAPPRAVASLSVRVVGGPERQGLSQLRPEPTAPAHSSPQPSQPTASRAQRAQQDSDDDSDDDEEEEEEEEDWGAGPRRGGGWEPPSSLAARERPRRTHQPPQHIPPQLPHHPQLQLRQPTPPPSPPPELSFPLPETPKQSPPSLDEPEGVAGARRHPPEGGRSPPALQRQDSSSSCGSSSSNSSSPEPHAGERKPGPLTLLARKMESEGAFAGSRKKGRAESEEQELAGAVATVTPTDGLAGTLFPGNLLREGGVMAIAHMAGPTPVPPSMGDALMAKKGMASAAVPTITFSTAVATSNQGARGGPFQAFGLTTAPARVVMATSEDSERDIAKAKEAEGVATHKADSQEVGDMQREREKALVREREEMERALDREREMEREKALQREREEREKALEREREKEREERENALQREREEREKALEREREKKQEEKEKALQREREEREKALEREREKEQEEREKALQREREEQEKALEREREKEREEKEKALQREREEREKALEREREKEREEKERALQREIAEREKALEREKEKEREEREKALQREREEREKALEREREKEREEREKALQREIAEREKALEHEKEKEREERERAQLKEREEREKAFEREREERVVLEKEKDRERESRLPPWKRGREFGGLTSSLISTPALSAVAGMIPEAEKKDQEKEEPATSHSLTKPPGRPGESQTTSPQPSTPLSPQPSSKKFRFLRDTPLLSSPSSASATPLIKRPRTFSDTPPPEAPTLPSSPRRPGLGEEGASGGESAIPAAESAIIPCAHPQREGVLQGPLPPAGGVLVVGPQPASRPPWPEGTAMEKRAPAEMSEPNNREGRSEPGRQREDRGCASAGGRPKPPEVERPEAPKRAMEAESGLLGAMGPVLPPSPPPEENEAERERERERRSSPSSDSSSSDSESASSSSHSSGSSSSSDDKSCAVPRSRRSASTQRDGDESPDTPAGPPRKRRGSQANQEGDGAANEGESHRKRPCTNREGKEQGEQKRKEKEGAEENRRPAREVKQAAMSESPGPECDQAPESSEGHAEESATPKAFTSRKISLTTASKPSPGSGAVSVGAAAPVAAPQGEAEPGGPAGRKRRWGSSTATTAKKPSISITTDSLKSLIPDIKPAAGPGSQEAVVELHPEEGRLSGDEEGADRGEGGGQVQDKDLKIRRTVTQVVHPEGQENGQKEPKRVDEEEEEEEEEGEADMERGNKEEKNSSSGSLEVAMEAQTPSATREVELKKVTPSDTLVRRSISQQKSGVSITIDDPVRTARQPSPPRGKITNIVHICNLVRPFTLGQLKELLNRTGTVVEEAFWIDKIKSHCYVTYSSTEEAVATRAALHGVKWPQSNPKFLSVDFCEQDELDFHRGLLVPDRGGEEDRGTTVGGLPGMPPSLLPERERGAGGVRDQWAQREREMERRERARAEREWDRDKVRDFGKPGEDREGAARRSRSRDRERRRKERGKSKERKTDKKEKAPEEPPAKLLDDLFCKTKAAPCIYWLPLTDQQALQREAERAERMKEREKRRKEQQEEEDRKREEERRERAKGREKEAGAPAGGAGGGTSAAAGGSSREGERERDRDRDRERERERERERGRDRDGDKRREGYRRPAGQGGGRRSRSRSDPPPRDRRR